MPRKIVAAISAALLAFACSGGGDGNGPDRADVTCPEDPYSVSVANAPDYGSYGPNSYFFDLRCADFRGQDLAEVVNNTITFAGVDARGADFREASFETLYLGSSQSGPVDLRHASFRGATIRGGYAGYDSDLREADFRDANLGYFDFRNVDLRGADFRGADLTYATFSRDAITDGCRGCP